MVALLDHPNGNASYYFTEMTPLLSTWAAVQNYTTVSPLQGTSRLTLRNLQGELPEIIMTDSAKVQLPCCRWAIFERAILSAAAPSVFTSVGCSA